MPSITINNRSFENPALSEDSSSYTAPSGWTFNNTAESGYSGVYDPYSSYASGVTGQNVLYLYEQGASVSQTTSKSYNSAEQYNFLLDIGDPNYADSQDFQVNLYAGNTLIGTSGPKSTGNSDALNTVEVYSSTFNPSLNGETIRIEVVKTGQDSQELWIDNVRASYASTSGGINWTGGTGNDQITGTAGDDDLVGDSDAYVDITTTSAGKKGKAVLDIDAVVGVGNDTIIGGDGDDIIYGDLDGVKDGFTISIDIPDNGGKGKKGSGADLDVALSNNLRGADRITGGDGADMIFAGVGDDIIYVNSVGHGYGDTVDGGSGVARFDFVAQDGKKGKKGGGSTIEESVSLNDDYDILDLTGSTQLGVVRGRIEYNPNNSEDGVVIWENAQTSQELGRLVFEDIEEVILPCLVNGTLISTARGDVAIEDLKVGDKVWTEDNGFQDIRWIGSRTVEGIGDFAPIKFAAGAVGNTREMRVSPQHRMVVSSADNELLFDQSEVLISAKHLINGRTVVREECNEVTYFHMLFDQHEIIRAEGAPVESFYPGTIGASAFEDDVRDELFELFPELFDTETAAIFGPMARPVLKKREAVLVRSHIN